MPLIGSGCTGNVIFWWTPPSLQKIREVSGSLLLNGRILSTILIRHFPPSPCAMLFVVCALPSTLCPPPSAPCPTRSIFTRLVAHLFPGASCARRQRPR